MKLERLKMNHTAMALFGLALGLIACDRSGDAPSKATAKPAATSAEEAATTKPNNNKAKADDSNAAADAEQKPEPATRSDVAKKHAAPSQAIAAPAEGISFDICKSELCFKQGHQKYMLDVRATELRKVEKTSESYTLTYNCAYCCGADETEILVVKRNSIRARLENSKAFRLHKQEKYVEATAGFAAAVKLDPELEMARTNLACALNLSGKDDDAAAVLLEDDGTLALATYMKLLSDPELESLRPHPRLQSLVAKKRGNAKLALDTGGRLLEFQVALSKQYGLVAVISTHQSWGSMQEAHFLELFDAKTGKRVYRDEFIGMWQTDPADDSYGTVDVGQRSKIKKRLTYLTDFLQTLGFDRVVGDALHVGKPGEGGPSRSFFLPHEKVGVTDDGVTLRTFRNGKLVKRFHTEHGLGYLMSVIYLPASQLLVVESHRDEPEGCYLGADIAVSAIMPVDLSLTVAASKDSD